MRHPARSVALAACLLLAAATASAAPARHATASKKSKAKPKPAPPIDRDEVEDEDEGIDEDAIEIEEPAPAKARSTGRQSARAKRDRAERDDDRRRGRDEDDDSDDDDTSEVETPAKARFAGKRKGARLQRDRDDDDDRSERKGRRGDRDRDDDDADEDSDSDRVAFNDGLEDSDEDTTESIRPPVRVRKRSLLAKPKDWHVAVGPYVWASSVDAEVSIGSASVGSGVDFMDITRHTRYGAELLAAVSYKRFKLSSDMMYGVIDLDGEKTVGPLMVSLNGSASSLLVDGNLSYMLVGGEQSWLSLEALAGVRYQRTSIEAAVGIGGSEVASIEKVTNVADALAGGRICLKPWNRLYASGAFDIGVFGDSTLTWSASADASVRITSRVLFSLGYRALTMNGSQVSMKMHGPRAALQLLF
jgi:hypothetical protein